MKAKSRSLASLGMTAPAKELAAIGRRFYERGWVYGTSGNFSVVSRAKPLRLIVTASSVHKGALKPAQFLEVDERGERIGKGNERPSAETLLHTEIVKRRGAGAVLHTHSVWSTILSGGASDQRGIAIQGFEMLKGLDGVHTHEHREWIPIVDNDQDMTRLARAVGETLDESPDVHGFLLRRHGLYTWGKTLADAERHVEILEFLFEAIGRSTEVQHGATQSS
jgi:methylthioribulose-1-phosphate dehydratase